VAFERHGHEAGRDVHRTHYKRQEIGVDICAPFVRLWLGCQPDAFGGGLEDAHMNSFVSSATLAALIGFCFHVLVMYLFGVFKRRFHDSAREWWVSL